MTAFDRAWELLKSQGCDGCAEQFDESQMTRVSLGGEAGQGWAFLCPSCAKGEEEYHNTPLDTSETYLDTDENDDEFIDPDAFNDPVPDIIEQIMGVFGDKPEMDMCYSCGLEGDLRTFYNTHPITSRRKRMCPSCGSYEIHGKNAYGGDFE